MWEFECVPSSVAAIEDARRDDTHVGAKKKAWNGKLTSCMNSQWVEVLQTNTSNVALCIDMTQVVEFPNRVSNFSSENKF